MVPTGHTWSTGAASSTNSTRHACHLFIEYSFNSVECPSSLFFLIFSPYVIAYFEHLLLLSSLPAVVIAYVPCSSWSLGNVGEQDHHSQPIPDSCSFGGYAIIQAQTKLPKAESSAFPVHCMVATRRSSFPAVIICPSPAVDGGTPEVRSGLGWQLTNHE